MYIKIIIHHCEYQTKTRDVKEYINNVYTSYEQSLMFKQSPIYIPPVS